MNYKYIYAKSKGITIIKYHQFIVSHCSYHCCGLTTSQAYQFVDQQTITDSRWRTTKMSKQKINSPWWTLISLCIVYPFCLPWRGRRGGGFLRFRFMVLNATFNNNSDISWWSVSYIGACVPIDSPRWCNCYYMFVSSVDPAFDIRVGKTQNKR
jgi:hypothetical protein